MWRGSCKVTKGGESIRITAPKQQDSGPSLRLRPAPRNEAEGAMVTLVDRVVVPQHVLVRFMDGESVLLNLETERYLDRKSTRLNSSHRCNSYAVFCLNKKTTAYRTSPSIPPLSSTGACSTPESYLPCSQVWHVPVNLLPQYQTQHNRGTTHAPLPHTA